MKNFILAIDQGTTSSRAIVFDKDLSICGSGQEEFEQHFPNSGWVEHEADDIWDTTIRSCHKALQDSSIDATSIKAIGITNQRETTLVWNRETGQTIHRAIVWQDRRTAAHCLELKAKVDENIITDKTGLLLDPYFSATKIEWILDNTDGARELADAGKLAFGTVDSYLIWRLTGGCSHVTDATNASRTMLYNIHTGEWDKDLLDLFNVPANMLPTVLDSAADFGTTDSDILGAAIPVCGVAGDQQAATVGQACFKPGMAKSTYGTGAFAMLNTGSTAVRSNNRLLTTIAYQLDGKPCYALEGSIFVAGAAVQWLRDGVKLINHASETQALAESADPSQDVYLVPAFTGLGAPYWDADARGALFGMTRNTGAAEITKATLESVAYQTRDLIEAMHKDWAQTDSDVVLRVDGGMTASDWTMQCIADTLNAPVDRPVVAETTALGSAYLAGYFAGLYPGLEEFAKMWKLDKRFEANSNEELREKKYAGWLDCVRRTRSN